MASARECRLSLDSANRLWLGGLSRSSIFDLMILWGISKTGVWPGELELVICICLVGGSMRPSAKPPSFSRQKPWPGENQLSLSRTTCIHPHVCMCSPARVYPSVCACTLHASMRASRSPDCEGPVLFWHQDW